jgi:hypothetical protein
LGIEKNEPDRRINKLSSCYQIEEDYFLIDDLKLKKKIDKSKQRNAKEVYFNF